MPESDDLDLPPHGWEGLPERTRFALERAWDSEVPGLASAVHARWWQLVVAIDQHGQTGSARAELTLIRCIPPAG